MVIVNDNERKKIERSLGNENRMKREIRVCVEQWSYKKDRREIKKNKLS